MNPEKIKDLKPIPWMEAYGRKQLTAAHVFYKRRGYYANCLCSECGAEYEIRTASTGDPFLDDAANIEKPERDKETKCRSCKIKATYKPAGSFATEWYEDHVVVGKKISDEEFVFRVFWCFKQIRKNCPASFTCYEIKRLYLKKGWKPMRFSPHYADHGKWISGGCGDTYSYKVHPSTYKEIKKTGMFKYVPECEYIKNQYYHESWVMDYYITAARYPDMEMMVKLGMDDLVYGLHYRYAIYFNPRGREIHDRLRINKERLKDLVKYGGNRKKLRLYQLERKRGLHWNDEDVEIAESLYKHDYNAPKRLETVLKYTTLKRFKKYFEKQGIWFGQSKDYNRSNTLRGEYFDYLDLRQKLGYDMTNDIILFPKNISKKHNEMVLESEKEQIKAREKEVLKKFPNIKKRFEALEEKYSAQAAGYIIRPAKDAAEIVMEGRMLHHCVGLDRYLLRHNTGETYILLLRKVDEPDMPYITVEIKDTQIIQWFGAYDKKPEEKYFDAWLNTYIKELKKRKKLKRKSA